MNYEDYCVIQSKYLPAYISNIYAFTGDGSELLRKLLINKTDSIILFRICGC